MCPSVLDPLLSTHRKQSVRLGSELRSARVGAKLPIMTKVVGARTLQPSRTNPSSAAHYLGSWKEQVQAPLLVATRG